MKLSTFFHPQTDGQAAHTIQTLEDMLRASIIDFKWNWDKHFPLVEFTYRIIFIHPSLCLPVKPFMVRGVCLLWMVCSVRAFSSWYRFDLQDFVESSYHKKLVANVL